MIVTPGQPGYLAPGTDLWRQAVTPSKVAAILGVSRWESPFRLWHRMKGITPGDPPKDAYDIGHDYEPAAANRWARKNPGWKISAGEVQFHVPAGHYPFPAVATLDRRASRGAWRRVVEVKIARNATDLEAWGDDLSGDCPEDYAAQVMAQMLFCGATQPAAGWTTVGDLLAIGPYFNERIYQIEYDANVASWIIEECTSFFASLKSDIPPDLDDTVPTYECLRELHPDIDGTTAPIDPALALDYAECVAAEKHAKAATQGAKNRLLAAMKTAQYAAVGATLDPDTGNYVGGFRIADRRNNGKGGVSLYPARNINPDNVRQTEVEKTA
jgi:putative phage-type endonuclease